VRRDPCGSSWRQLYKLALPKRRQRSAYGLARRQIQRGAQILPEHLQQLVQCSSAHPGAFHLGQLLVLGWRFLLGGQIRGLIAGERERLELWVEWQPWGRAQEMALRRLLHQVSIRYSL
jgi:hypothetical protein